MCVRVCDARTLMKVKCGSSGEYNWYFCLQLRLLSGVEEENEIVRQQEKTLKSELTLLRSKLANCETELLQCKNKIQ
jgi:hypothetical protein